MIYVLLVAVVNLIVGFAVAVRLGNRYSAIAMADQHWEFKQLLPPSRRMRTPDSEESGDEVPEDDEPSDSEPEESNETPSEEDKVEVEQAEEEVAVADSEPEEDEVAEEEAEGKSKISLAIEALQAEAAGLNEQLTETDDQLRECLESPEENEINGILGSLREATDDYIDKRNAVQEKLEAVPEEDETFQAMWAEVEAAVTSQDESIESVNSAIESFDYQGDLEEGCRRMIGETGKLIDENRQLAGELDKAAVEVARQEDRLETTDDGQRRDSLTGLSNRAGMEANMASWWKDDPNRIRQLSMILVDLDALEDLNEVFRHRRSRSHANRRANATDVGEVVVPARRNPNRGNRQLRGGGSNPRRHDGNPSRSRRRHVARGQALRPQPDVPVRGRLSRSGRAAKLRFEATGSSHMRLMST